MGILALWLIVNYKINATHKLIKVCPNCGDQVFNKKELTTQQKAATAEAYGCIGLIIFALVIIFGSAIALTYFQ